MVVYQINGDNGSRMLFKSILERNVSIKQNTFMFERTKSVAHKYAKKRQL